MKQQVFNQYAKEVGKVFNISNEDIFKKNKAKNIGRCKTSTILCM